VPVMIFFFCSAGNYYNQHVLIFVEGKKKITYTNNIKYYTFLCKTHQRQHILTFVEIGMVCGEWVSGGDDVKYEDRDDKHEVKKKEKKRTLRMRKKKPQAEDEKEKGRDQEKEMKNSYRTHPRETLVPLTMPLFYFHKCKNDVSLM
jgi:hypothetical protein